MKVEKMDQVLALSIIEEAIKVALEEEKSAAYNVKKEIISTSNIQASVNISKEIIKNNSNSLTEQKQITDSNIGYVALGVKELDNYIFSNYRQTLVVLKSNSFTKENMVNIFGKKFLDDNYSKYSDKGFFMGYDLVQLQDDLINQCVMEGNYDIENVKGYGIFADPLSKKHLIVNTSKIWGTCDTYDKKRIRGKTIFSNQKDLKLNEDQVQISKEEVKRFENLLKTWNFSRGDQDIKLIAGWILMAPLAGVSKWRTHASLTGRRGTGKSTLQETINNFLGKFSKMFEGSSSEAGLRQQMGNSSGALLLDESEADGVKLAQILAMLRASSSGSQKALGTQDQNGAIFELKMAGLLGGIVPPDLKGADNSRFLKIELGIRDESIENDDLFNIEWQEEVGLKTIMTMVKNYHILLDLINKVRILFLNKGYDGRYADTYGPLIASSFLFFELIEDPIIDASTDPFDDKSELYQVNHIKEYTVKDIENYLDKFNFDKEKEQSKYSDEEELLTRIFTTEITNDELQRDTIIKFILGYHLPNCSQKGAIKNLLGNYGIKTERDEDDELYVFFDCSDLKLKQILSKSRFGSGDIKAVLKRVQYAEEMNKQVRIGGTKRSAGSLIKLRLDKDKYSLSDEIVLESKKDIEDNPFK